MRNQKSEIRNQKTAPAGSPLLDPAEGYRKSFAGSSQSRKTLRGLCLVSCVLCLLSVTSCFKEKPLPAPSDQSIGQTQVIEMGPAYSDQFFYSLETNSVLSHNSRLIYDLMFDCNANKFHIWLNTAKFMSVVRTNKTVLSDVTMNDTIGIDFRYDLGEFNPDSNALGKWWDTLSDEPTSAGKVYIINLGKDALGNDIGYRKMKVNNFSSGAYSVTYSSFSSSDSTTLFVQKDATRNYAYLSFTSNSVLPDIEPDKSLWDLCFTRYTVIFYEPDFTLPYIVTGVLHNPERVTAYMDSTITSRIKFDSIRIKDFEFNRLLTRRDAIGYTWKKVENVTSNFSYNLNKHFTYFIKTDEDKYYILHFFDFYREIQTGYPAFEYYKL